MSTDAPRTAPRARGPLIVAVLAAFAHIFPGFLMLVSGLVAPLWAVALMLLAWTALAVLLVRMAARGSWWTPVVPITALGLWALVLTLGERLLGWTA